MRHAVSFFLVLTCAVAAAQEFGQWSWDGSVSAAIRKYADRIEETQQKSTQNDYRLGLGVQGFVLHPAIAAFRVGVDGALSRYARTTSLDTKRIGYRGDLRVLPQGAWPLHVFATRQNYDYGTSSRDDALLLLAVPDRSTTWGGTVRLRSGPLAGLLAGIDHTKIDFATAATQSQTSAGQYADWSRGSAKLQQHYRLDRQSRDFGSYGYTLRDLTLTTDDHGFVRAWRWDLSSAAIRRTIDTATAPAAAFDLGRVQGHLGTAKPERAAWDLAWNSGVSGAGSNKVQTHSMVGRYLRRIDGGFQLAPTVGFGVQRSPSSHVTSPQAGLGVNWNGHRRSFDLAASAVAGYLLLNSSGRDGSSRQSRISTSFGASVGHGSESGFRQQFEVSASRNQLRIAGDSFANTPELGTAVAGTGTENVTQARMTLRRGWDSKAILAFSDWTRRSSADPFTSTAFTAQTLVQTLQINARSFSFLVNAGRSAVEQSVEQEIRYVSAAASWRPLASLTLTAIGRRERRATLFEPPINGQRFEANASWRLGATYISPQFFMATEELQGQERVNRGAAVNVSRQFGGWLPFVSGPRRRGVVQ